MYARPLPRHPRRLRVLVADDHPFIRKAVRTTLERHPHFEVCAEAENGALAVRMANEFKPDVVVLDINMPFLNGFEAARQIKKEVPQIAVVILSSNVG